MINLSKNYGYSLVELLVSITIAGVILAGVVGTVVSSRKTFVTDEELSIMQENARYAFEVLSRDIRVSGFSGCAPPFNSGFANVLKDDLGGFIKMLPNGIEAIEGFDGNTAAYPPYLKGDVINGSDVLVVRGVDPSTEARVRVHDEAKASFTFFETHDFKKDEYLLAVDTNCRVSGLFRASGKDDFNVLHKANGSNCTTVLRPGGGRSLDCSDCDPDVDDSCKSDTPSAYPSNTNIFRFTTSAYYVGESQLVPGMPALKRRYLTRDGSQLEEVLQGVEQFDVSFGVDLDAAKDGEIDAYVKAGELQDEDGDGNPDWESVVAVKFALVLRSQTPYHDQVVENTFDDGSGNFADEDRFLRRRISQVIKMRNR